MNSFQYNQCWTSEKTLHLEGLEAVQQVPLINLVILQQCMYFTNICKMSIFLLKGLQTLTHLILYLSWI